MRKLMRETIREIRDNGGTAVTITHGSRHTRIHFTNHDGRRLLVLIPQGHASSHVAAGIRSRVRRLVQSNEPEAACRAGAEASVLLMQPARLVRRPAAA